MMNCNWEECEFAPKEAEAYLRKESVGISGELRCSYFQVNAVFESFEINCLLEDCGETLIAASCNPV